MASILPPACLVLSVFLSLGFNSAHRFLLDQTNGDHKNTDPVHYEAVKNPKAEGAGFSNRVGLGSGDRSSAYGSGTRQGVGSGGSGFRYGAESGIGSGPGGSGYGSKIGVRCDSGSAPGCDPGFIGDIIGRMLPFPLIPWPPKSAPSPCDEPVHHGGPCNPGNKEGSGNCHPEPCHEHQTGGGSATGAAKEMQEAINIVGEPYPQVIDHNQP
ncbi:hypothetical protein DITRI_Ditri14bG0117700 [Diplodiscus trichospermus]